jgi:hypothetical protein
VALCAAHANLKRGAFSRQTSNQIHSYCQSKTQYRIEQLRDGTILEYTDAKPIVSDYFKIPDNPSIFDEFPALDTDEVCNVLSIIRTK